MDKIRVTKRADIEAKKDEERSAEIQLMRVYMRRYPDKAREEAVKIFDGRSETLLTLPNL